MYLPDYYIFPDPIDADTHTWIYRSIRYSDQRRILLKCLKNLSPTIAALNRLQNEYAITQIIDAPGIIRSIDLIENRRQLILLLEDNGSVPIAIYPFSGKHETYFWGQEDGLPIEMLWPIALQLIEILDQLETHQITYPDLVPQNLWIHPLTQTITLMNFEQASRSVHGDLPDYHGLGCVLYELLTGIRPGNLSEPVRSPDRLNPTIPIMLSRLVMRLLAPASAPQYHSLQGIQHDLVKCQAEWQTHRSIAEFELGTRERRDRFRVSDRLYGREVEIELINALFTKIADYPEKALLQISGASGVGKTAIVNQLQISRGYFIRGKFDPVNRDLPLSAILQAFRDLIGQWRNESDNQRAMWQQTLRNALGSEAAILLEILPELTNWVDKPPEVTTLMGEALGNRFNLVLRRFVRVLASTDHPLVLFLDDVQWADRSSLRLLHQWMQDESFQHFLCIVAYRDHEISSVHPFARTIDTLLSEKVVIQDLSIAPLGKSAINQMVADTLHCTEDLSLPLSEELWLKTKGNPFFSIQLFKAFYQDQYLTYNPEDQCWQCDLNRIRTAQLSDDVMNFMIDRLMRLVSPTRSILSLAACLGNEFDLTTLAIISEQSELTIAAKLWRALQEGLIIPVNQMYKFPPINSPSCSDLNHQEAIFGNVFGSVFESTTYQFLHDRVQQAAYALIPDIDKPVKHLHIGRRLQVKFQSQLNTGTLADRELFDLMSQFNQGLTALEDPDEQLAIAKLNLTAGKRAAATTAYQSALDYAKAGLSLLPVDRWTLHERLTRSLYELAAETAYLSGNFDQTPTFISVLQQHSHSVIDCVGVCEIQIRAYAAEGRPLAAVELALIALEKLGVPIAHNPNLLQIAIALVKLRWIFLVRSPEYFLSLPTMTNEKAITIARILHTVSYLIVLSAPKLLPSVTLMAIHLTLNYGNSIDSIYSYLCSATILTAVWNHINIGYEVGQIATKLLDRDENHEVEARVKIGLGVFINHWKVQLSKIAISVQPCYQKSLDMGNFEHAAWAFHTYTYHQYYAGFNLATLEQTFKEAIPLIKQLNQVGAFRFIQMTQAVISVLRGVSFIDPTQKDDRYLLDDLSQSAQAVNSRTELFCIHYNQGMLQYHFGQQEEAYRSFQNAHRYRDAGTTIVVLGLQYFYAALSMAEQYSIQSQLHRRNLRSSISRNMRYLHRAMKHCSENYANKYYLVKAEYARVTSDRTTAMDAYEQAIAFAQRHQLTHELALAYELAARFYAQWKQELIAQLYMKKAYDTYESWGATAKVEHLKCTYPCLLPTIE